MKKLTIRQMEQFPLKWIKLEDIYIPATLFEDYSDICVYEHPELEAKLHMLKTLKKDIKSQYKELKKSMDLYSKISKQIENLDSGT
jgi:hypothetical protein